MNFLRKPWAWVLIVIAAVLILFTLLPSDSSEEKRPLVGAGSFVESAEKQKIQSVEVDGRELEYKLVGDEQTYRAKMEEGDTVRQVLQDAGIEPDDFPPIKIKDPNSLGQIPALILNFLPIIFIVAILFFFLRKAQGSNRVRDVDPVCGKRVGPHDAAGISTFQDISYRFCSSDCKQRFDADPVRYLLST